MAQYPDLQGQVALITGSSRGIGFGIAEELTKQGVKVVLTARNNDALQEAVQSLPEGMAIGIAGKTDDPEHRQEVLNTIESTFGRLDILINNAGINPVYGPIAEVNLGAVEKVLGVNVVATLGWVQDVLAHKGLGFEEHRGRIVNLSSVTGDSPAENIGVYGVSKAAVSHLTRTLAYELAPNIRVNAVAPAVVKTRFAVALYEGREEEVSAQYPLKRLGTPEDIAAAAVFLCSDVSSWVTAQVLTLDGGLLVSGGKA